MTARVREEAKPTSFFVSSGLLAFFILLAVSTYLTTPLGSSEFYARLHRSQTNTGSLVDKLVGVVETAAGEQGLIFLKAGLIFLFIAGFALVCIRSAKSQFIGLSLSILVAACSFEATNFSYSFFSLPKLLRYEFYSGFDLLHFSDYRIAGVIILSILFAYYLKNSQRFSKKEAVLILTLAFFSILVPDLAIWSMSYAAFAISRIYGEKERAEDRISTGLIELQRRLSKLPADGLVWLALVFCILNIRSLCLEPINDQFFPITAMNHVVDKELEGPILSAPIIGSYINYRLGLSTFAKAALTENLEESDPRDLAFAAKLFKDASKLGYLIARYQTKTALCINTDALCLALSNDPDWQKVYPKEASSTGVYNWTVYRILQPRSLE